MVKKIYSYCFLFLFTNLILIQRLYADYLFPAGSKSKIVGIANPSDESGGFSTLYNPSNIAFESTDGSSVRLDSEVGFFYLKHIYDHPFDYKLDMSVKSNYASLGVAWKISDNLYLGGILFPDKYVKMQVDALPQKIFSHYVADLNVYLKELQIKSALGLSYKISDTKIGLAVSDTYEKTKLKITTVDKETTINRVDAHCNALGWVLGLSFGLSTPYVPMDISAVYTSETIKNYHGDSSFILDQKESQKITDYTPSSLSFGISSYLPWKLKLTLSGIYSHWTKGKDHLNNKYSNIKFVSDIKNTFDYFISVHKQFLSSVISLGFSYLHSPWGNGSFSDDPTDFTVGTDFTKLDNVNRFTLGIGYALALSSSFILELVTSYSSGTRSVPMNGYNPGKYSTKLFLTGLNLRYSF